MDFIQKIKDIIRSKTQKDVSYLVLNVKHHEGILVGDDVYIFMEKSHLSNNTKVRVFANKDISIKRLNEDASIKELKKDSNV